MITSIIIALCCYLYRLRKRKIAPIKEKLIRTEPENQLLVTELNCQKRRSKKMKIIKIAVSAVILLTIIGLTTAVLVNKRKAAKVKAAVTAHYKRELHPYSKLCVQSYKAANRGSFIFY